jgi:hypothetical protein
MVNGERVIALRRAAEVLSPRVRAAAGMNRDEGVGVAEAPRGTLIARPAARPRAGRGHQPRRPRRRRPWHRDGPAVRPGPPSTSSWSHHLEPAALVGAVLEIEPEDVPLRCQAEPPPCSATPASPPAWRSALVRSRLAARPPGRVGTGGGGGGAGRAINPRGPGHLRLGEGRSLPHLPFRSPVDGPGGRGPCASPAAMATRLG